MRQRQLWESDLRKQRKSGRGNAARIVGVAKVLRLRENQVATDLNHADAVAAAADIAGQQRSVRSARTVVGEDSPLVALGGWLAVVASVGKDLSRVCRGRTPKPLWCL
jgi:hypothetical protein